MKITYAVNIKKKISFYIGVCVKLRTKTGDKGFINICHTDKIPAPKDISDETLVNVATSDNPSFIIPMSIGQEKFDPDKGKF